MASQAGRFTPAFKGYKKVKEGDELGTLSTPTFWEGAVAKTTGDVGSDLVLKSPDLNEKLTCKVSRQDEKSTWVQCPVPANLDSDSQKASIKLVLP